MICLKSVPPCFFFLLFVNAMWCLEEAEDNNKEGRESHFPNIPNLPATEKDVVVLVLSENATEFERRLIGLDSVGDPLDAEDFRTLADAEAESPDESVLEGNHFEGDILGVALRSLDENDADSDARNAVINSFQKWPSGQIPYVISRSFSRRQRGVIYAAIAQFEARSCVRWKPRTEKDADYVHILRDDGCYSRVGRTGGPQVLSLGKNCIVFDKKYR